MADYASLQKLALSDKGQDEAVTVNQRALIGKRIPSTFAADDVFQTRFLRDMPQTTQLCVNCCRTPTTQMQHS